jgi:hypothetical protein
LLGQIFDLEVLGDRFALGLELLDLLAAFFNGLLQLTLLVLIEWLDNADISAQSPADYWPQFKNRYTETDWPTVRYWHALPENWEAMNTRTS